MAYLRLHEGSGMPLNIRNEQVNQLAENLAAQKRVNKTEAVRIALENELRRASMGPEDARR